MAATVEVRIHHGAAPGLGVDATGATLRLKRADSDAQDAAFPVPIPAAGLEYSWRKSFRLVILTAPDNEISNLRFFSDGGSAGVGRRILYARSTPYVQASAADEAVAISAVDVTTLLVGAPEVLEPGVLCDDTDVYPLAEGAAGQQDYSQLQLETGPTAVAGTGGSVVCRLRYNET